LAGVACAFQVSLHQIECQVEEPSNILEKHPSGPSSRNKGKSKRPEVTVICRASSLASVAEGLAGNASGHKVSLCKGVVMGQLLEVRIAWNVWPVLGQHGAAVGIDFHLSDNRLPKQVGPGVVYAANARTQRE
jgi:hypothetical protein